MSKKVKVIISVVVTVLLLTIGTTAVVMAQEDGSASTSNTTGIKGLFARVADNLDITEEELIDAFQQARQEMREEAFLRAVERAEEKGLIDGDEADEIIEWWGEKPEALNRIWSPRFSGCSALDNGHMWNKRWHSTFGMRGDDGRRHWQGQCRLANGA